MSLALYQMMVCVCLYIYSVPSSISDDGVCLTTYYSVPSSISDDGVCLTTYYSVPSSISDLGCV